MTQFDSGKYLYQIFKKIEYKKFVVFFTKFDHLSSEIWSNHKEFGYVNFKFGPDSTQKNSKSNSFDSTKIIIFYKFGLNYYKFDQIWSKWISNSIKFALNELQIRLNSVT